MSRCDLGTYLRRARLALDEVATFTTNLPTGSTVPSTVLNILQEAVQLAPHLDSALSLLPARKEALESLHELRQAKPTANPALVRVGEREVLFATLRLLRLQSYMATTWAIYDTITTVAAPLACTRPTMKERTAGAPALLSKVLCNNALGSLITDSILHSYGWPLGFSYQVRNRVLHEGDTDERTPIFDGTDVAAGFTPRNDTLKLLGERCEAAPFRLIRTWTRRPEPWPWVPGDLLAILERCHEEADEALGILLTWTIGAMRSQVVLLNDRDLG